MGRTALHYASAEGELQAAGLAIDAGADINAADTAGWTPLHFAAQSQATAIVDALLAAGADPQRADKEGNTPLWRAVFTYRGDPGTVQALLAAGADPDLENRRRVSERDLAERIATTDVADHIPLKGTGPSGPRA